MLEGDGNTRNKAEVGWRDFITIRKHHGRKSSCHIVEVESRGHDERVCILWWGD